MVNHRDNFTFFQLCYFLFVCISDLALHVSDFSAIVKHHNKRITVVILIFIAAAASVVIVVGSGDHS
jgi:hypothetical protein